ncbi:MAG: hypothetical protein ACRDY4_11295, partial [Acidimicrobiia bacterium]
MSDRYDDDAYEPDPRRHRDPRASRRQAQPPTSGEGVRILGSDDDADDDLDLDSGRRGADEPRYGDVPARPDPEVRPAARFPLPEDDDTDLWKDDDGPTWSASSQGAGGVGGGADEGSGEVDLPHWTEPATGEVPRILPDVEPTAQAEDDLDSWASMSGSTPRFRSEPGDWAEGDFASPESLKDDETAVGALADEPVFDDDADFDERVAERRRPRGRGRGRGQA